MSPPQTSGYHSDLPRRGHLWRRPMRSQPRREPSDGQRPRQLSRRLRRLRQRCRHSLRSRWLRRPQSPEPQVPERRPSLRWRQPPPYCSVRAERRPSIPRTVPSSPGIDSSQARSIPAHWAAQPPRNLVQPPARQELSQPLARLRPEAARERPPETPAQAAMRHDACAELGDAPPLSALIHSSRSHSKPARPLAKRAQRLSVLPRAAQALPPARRALWPELHASPSRRPRAGAPRVRGAGLR